METKHVELSFKRLHGLGTQGNFNYSDSKLSELAFVNRFIHSLCSLLLIIGIGLSNIPILSTSLVISIFGVTLRNLPFYYIYNNLLVDLLNKPQLPPCSKQLKFAYSISAARLAATIYLFYTPLKIKRKPENSYCMGV